VPNSQISYNIVWLYVFCGMPQYGIHIFCVVWQNKKMFNVFWVGRLVFTICNAFGSQINQGRLFFLMLFTLMLLCRNICYRYISKKICSFFDPVCIRQECTAGTVIRVFDLLCLLLACCWFSPIFQRRTTFNTLTQYISSLKGQSDAIHFGLKGTVWRNTYIP
jgi:hypothetical protein